MNSSLIVIAGPTAVGKSVLAMQIASEEDGEILCADSRQIYRKMDIGTAKPTLEEQHLIPHHLLNLCDMTETLTLAQYKQQAEVALQDIWQRGKQPVMVGGTGLYINALLYDYQIPEVPPQQGFRQEMQQLEKSAGVGTLFQKLKACDPSTAERLHPHDQRRIIRALEVFQYTGKPISTWQIKTDSPRFSLVYVGLRMEKSKLEIRIKDRIRHMIDAGLIEEVKCLREYYGKHLPLMKTLNYGEIGRYLDGELNLKAAQEEMCIHTRQYAKRQMTWFRQDLAIRWFDVQGSEDLKKVKEWIQGLK